MMYNSEMKKEMIVLSSLTAALCTAAAFYDKKCFVTVLICSAVFICSYFIIMRVRHKRIAALSEKLDSVLHGKDVQNMENFCEGDLSVLENEIQKLLTKYKEQNERLKKEKTNLSDSLADISHQLRTPLTGMNLLTAMLGAPELEDEKRLEHIGELSSLLNSTEQLVDLLLKIARLDAGADILEKKTISADECINNALKLLAIPVEIKEICIENDVGGESFTGDMRWTVEAFSNIIKNCIEHVPQGGKIRISANETSIFTSVTISDNGGGFDEEDIAHLFERFYKGKSSAGFGIGLSLASVIIRRQNGTVKAYNTAEGACFEIKFYRQIV